MAKPELVGHDAFYMMNYSNITSLYTDLKFLPFLSVIVQYFIIFLKIYVKIEKTKKVSNKTRKAKFYEFTM